MDGALQRRIEADTQYLEVVTYYAGRLSHWTGAFVDDIAAGKPNNGEQLRYASFRLRHVTSRKFRTDFYARIEDASDPF